MSSQAERMLRLREVMGIPTQTAMAAALGIKLTRWNNIERGQSRISQDIVIEIRRRFPGVTSDWLLFGDPRGLPLELAQRLGELPNANPSGRRRR